MHSTSRVALAVFALVMSACTGISESTAPSTAVLSSETFSCSYFGQYDDVTSCQIATNASCTYATVTYPNATLGVCYYPPVGYETCVATPASWIYTAWGDWCELPDNTYQRFRSVIACSSTICACNTTAITQQNCVSSGDCALTVNAPNPLTSSPAPLACP